MMLQCEMYEMNNASQDEYCPTVLSARIIYLFIYFLFYSFSFANIVCATPRLA